MNNTTPRRMDRADLIVIRAAAIGALCLFAILILEKAAWLS